MASIQFKKNMTGKKTYYVVVSFRAKHKWVKAGSLKSAKSLKKQLESLEESERLVKLGFSHNDIRIDDFFKQYAEYIKLHTSDSTAKRYLGVLNTFVVFLKMYHSGVRSMSQITTQTIESYQQKRLESIDLKTQADGVRNGVHRRKELPKPQTVNFEVGVLRSAFIWAHDREIISSVPTKKVKKLKHIEKRKARVLTPNECKSFLKTGREFSKENKRYKVYTLIFQFILNSGLRSGEICNLTWDDINLETGLMKIQPKPGWTPKSYSREFYLNNVCLKLLNRIKEREGYVFVSIEGNQFSTDMLRNALIKVAKLAGLRGFTRVHDLRHTYATLLQTQGVDVATTGDILGHEDYETTRIYSHTYKEHLKRAVNRVSVN